ncbi:hypothetical protein WMZ97_10830 [Lentibacillus sp. N15]
MEPKSWEPIGKPKEKIEQENMPHAIEQLIPDRSIVISDVGAHKMSIAGTFQPKGPGRMIISNGSLP